jgi:hypothetical protein
MNGTYIARSQPHVAVWAGGHFHVRLLGNVKKIDNFIYNTKKKYNKSNGLSLCLTWISVIEFVEIYQKWRSKNSQT